MLKQIKQRLTHERSMKQDAFHQVDELLTQMNNLDMVKTNTKIAIATKGMSTTSPAYSSSLIILLATRSTPGLTPHSVNNRTMTSHSFHVYPKTAAGDSGELVWCVESTVAMLYSHAGNGTSPKVIQRLKSVSWSITFTILYFTFKESTKTADTHCLRNSWDEPWAWCPQTYLDIIIHPSLYMYLYIHTPRSCAHPLSPNLL